MAGWSKRALKGLRPLAGPLAPALALLLRSCWRTYRISVRGEEHLLDLLARQQVFIPCCWHQRQLVCAQYLIRRQEGGLRIGLLISPSQDGELASALASHWRVPVIRGSSSRDSGQAIRNLYHALSRERICPVLTPDGPRGPVRHFKTGTAVLAQISRAPLLPMAYAAGRAWKLRSWDRFMIPLPFTQVALAIGAPHSIPSGLSLEELQPYRRRLEEILNQLETEAEELLHSPQ